MRKMLYAFLATCLIVTGFAIQPDLASASTPKIALSASPATASSGVASVRLSATVKNGKSGQRVTIERRLSAKDSWTTVKTLSLPSNLRVKVSTSPKLGKNYYRVRVARKGSTKAAKSATVAVTGVIRVNPKRPNASKKATYSGVLPTAFKRKAQLQVLHSGKWQTIQTATSRSSGSVTFTQALKGKSSVRIYAPKVSYKKKIRGAFASPPVLIDPLLAPNPKVDSDKDKLPDYIEQRIGTKLGATDSDGDGLWDDQELVLSTNPLTKDSDGNGKLDPVDDLDKDGVANRVELADGTKAYAPDTDGDALNDGDEKKRKTNPLKGDSDGDGVDDGVEVKVGSNPLKADSDGDGTPDSDETFGRTVTSAQGATFDANGPAEAIATVKVAQLPDSEFNGLTGGLGSGVAVTSDGKLDSGVLTIPFDTSKVTSGDDVAVLHFDEATGELDQPADQTVDLAAGTATVRTTSFSPFIVVNLDEFKQIWKSEIVEPREGNGQSTQNVDAVVALDSSGSMAWNDPNGDRKVAAKSFVDSLIAGDRAGAIDFDDSVRQIQHLTSDFTVVKSLINSIDDSGGTDIGAPVRGALDELDENGDSKHGRIVVLLTDGEGSYDTSLTTRAADSSTKIYTVGLGSSVDETLLGGIATGTGGKYFQVAQSGQLPGAFDRIIGDIGAPDTDDDGLSDTVEASGWRTQRGIVYKTDPNKSDTDGDGVLDGDEAGALTTGSFGKAYLGISDPNKSDSDGDSLSDMDELTLGTNARAADTDADGLKDNTEVSFGSDPTEMNADGDTYLDSDEYRLGLDPLSYDLTSDERDAAFLGGFIFGDWYDGAKNVGRMSDAQVQSIHYIGGQFVSGVIVIGDVRDLIVHIGEKDFLKSLLAGAAFIPVFGDVGKLGKQLSKFAKLGPIAEKNAFRAIQNTPLPIKQKKAIGGSVFGSGVKVFPKILEGGPAKTYLYWGVLPPKKRIYVGITNDIARRTSQHGARFDVEKINVGPMTRGKARAVEEALMVRACGSDIRNCAALTNKIHSISPTHEYYSEAKAWADNFIKTNWL